LVLNYYYPPFCK